MSSYKVQQVAKGGKLPLTIVRAGKTMKVDVPVTPNRPRLVGSLNGTYPEYFVYGPIVFSRATVEFRSYFSNNANSLNALAFNAHPLVTRIGEEPDADREDLVVVSAPFFRIACSRATTGASAPWCTPLTILRYAACVTWWRS